MQLENLYNKVQRTRVQKIFFLYIFLAILFIVFLFRVVLLITGDKHLPSLYSSHTATAIRGKIISADHYTLASANKLYKATVHTKNLNPKNIDLFITLFSIYSGMPTDIIKKKLNKKMGIDPRNNKPRKMGIVILSIDISEQSATQLKNLYYQLYAMNVFIPYTTPSGKRVIQGLQISEYSQKRIYPYSEILTPVLGFTQRNKNKEDRIKILGKKGLERSLNDYLSNHQDAYYYGGRDVINNIIFNKQSISKVAIDGYNVYLGILISLQIKIEMMLDKFKKKIDADEILIAIMESGTGKILSIASSNRYLPFDIKKNEIPYLKSNVVEYMFEPGSVIKPISFSILLDREKISPYELVNGNHGSFKIGKKIITDEHQFGWLSAEDVIVHSSNIGMAKLAQKFDGSHFHNQLIKFGFTQKLNIRLSNQQLGSIPTKEQLSSKIYKAVTSYGYGMDVNFIQILRAYNIFNNNGKRIEPYLVDYIQTPKGEISLRKDNKAISVIQAKTAKMMRKILVKTVNKGTGRGAITKGIEVGGKTGTAHIAINGEYIFQYHTSFFGFANDKKNKYTIGVTVIKPKTKHFASQTAVPVFKKALDILIEENLLLPNNNSK